MVYTVTIEVSDVEAEDESVAIDRAIEIIVGTTDDYAATAKEQK
jgi:hypothetical protein